ncbi:helix-turn-helix domain-containing protein [Paenibacillus caseinilyticus]|uniref:AraC family transcriptional regulator n=1 Tax=Paenibacillus mucilaginosus K02 TaxID=997761 RepID=I0BFN5_9BACL|nr:AraC family transcriptional regulator [Paenibacillus mucilaginosus]AFH61182.1 AraC family transcriptional regulator [Paenibacillus mucilaginosus K02]
MNQIRMHTGSFPLVRDVGMTLTSEGWVHPDRITDFNVFIFVIKGQMQVVEEGTEYILRAGMGFFLKSGLHHLGTAGTIPGTSTIWIHFSEGLQDAHVPERVEEGSLQPFQASRTYKVFGPVDYRFELLLPKLVELQEPASFISKVKDLYELYCSAPLFGHVLLSIKTMELFLDLYRLHHDPERHRMTSKSDAVVRKLALYLEEHWESLLEPERIRAEFGLNYRYMSTLFKTRMGISIFHYHERHRIHRAAELLKSTSMNISEVSDKLKYTSPYYFSRVFKKVMGEAPSVYIRNIYKM